MPILQYTKDCLDAAQGKWPASGGDYKRKDRPKTIAVFENRFIEMVFAKAHPLTPALWFGPFIAYGVYLGVTRRGALFTVGVFLAGWLAWTLMEYLLHRFLFHMGAETPEQKFRQFMVHGYHHEFPVDGMRLVAPPMMSWPLALVVCLLYRLLLGPQLWLVLFAGTATGYIAYDWIHYYTHHFRPRTFVGKFLKSYHLLHHFDDYHGRQRYGVSSPLWDLVFGTYRPISEKGRASKG